MKLLFLVLFPVLAFAGLPTTQIQQKNVTTNVTTSTWGTLVSSLQKEVGYVDVYNSSTSGTLILGVGAVGSEYNALYIPASTARTFPLTIHRNSRVSVKALNATVSTGELILNFIAVD